MSVKFAKVSYTEMNELVLPNDTNMLHNLMGGRLLHWMDIAAGIAAQKHCQHVAVTASVDTVSFNHPVKLGEVVTIKAQVTRAFNTSVEVYISVHAQNFSAETKHKTNEAYYTFVALDAKNNKVKVPALQPETPTEFRHYEEALTRRQLRLLLAGKIKVNEAQELIELLSKNASGLTGLI